MAGPWCSCSVSASWRWPLSRSHRRLDVRLVLFVAALVLGGLAGDLGPVIRTFLVTLSSEQFIVPICSAMGFAQVLRHSGCDQHLVQLLVKPIRHVRALLIPGHSDGRVHRQHFSHQPGEHGRRGERGARAAFASGADFGDNHRSRVLLGASIGGELLNPGAPEMNTVARVLKVESSQCVERVLPHLLVQFTVATAVFWLISVRAEKRRPSEEAVESEQPPDFRVNLFKAAVPILPLLILMIVGPPFNLITVPQGWLVEPPRLEPLRSQMNDAVGVAYDRSAREAAVSHSGAG